MRLSLSPACDYRYDSLTVACCDVTKQRVWALVVETWVMLAIAGAFLQNLRSGLQKTLTPQLQVLGAAYTRFVFALPFAIAYLWWLSPDVAPTPSFWVFATAGAVSQIAATIFLLQAFTTQNFAVATALSKTETLQTAALGVLLFAEWISQLAIVGVLLSLLGLWLLNGRRGGAVSTPAGNWFGLAAGLGLAGAAVFYRAAAISLTELNYLEQAACTLAVALFLQTVILGFWMAARNRSELMAVVHSWRSALWVGFAGFLTSVCWFSAMALVTAAYVRAVGQIELLFSFALSVFWFRERANRLEVAGVVVLSAGIVFVLLGR